MQQDSSKLDRKPKANTGLTIGKRNKEVLTPNQQAFNKLTARIEKLHKEIAKKETQFDEALLIYSNAIHPLRQEILQQKRAIIDQLWPVYKGKQLSKPDLRHLKLIIQNYVEVILQSTDTPDEALKEIFGELEGESYDKVKQREEELMKEEVQAMFKKSNIDIDLSDVEFNSKDFAAKMAEAQHQMRERMAQDQQQHHHQTKSKQRVLKKTAKQLEAERMQEAVEALKQKNISTIYRQLAKLFHPDLEQDEHRRIEKEALMKQLTAAYEAKNLHALLSLELKWIHKENDHLASLTEEKLAVYLQILREQAQQLEQAKYRVFDKPQYGILFDDFGHHIASQPLTFLKHQQKGLENEVAILKNETIQFQSEHSLRFIKRMIKSWKEYNESNAELEDIFESILLKNGRSGW